MRALIVPRPGAEPGDHWYQFVAERVEAGAVPGLTAAEVRLPTEQDDEAIGSLVLVGHEGSAATIAGFLSSLKAGSRAAGILLVTPPATEGDWRPAGRLRVLLSDDPGYVDRELMWIQRHRAEVAVRPGGKSFYGAHEIAVLINLAALAAEIAAEG